MGILQKPYSLPRIALGCYPLGGGYGPVDVQEARSTIDAAIEVGWTFFDTAEAYLDSESRVGEILQGRRDKVFLATKVFPCEEYTFKNVERALENSLRNLKTDWIDLYQLHGPQDWVMGFQSAPPLDQVSDILQRLIDSNKIRHAGVCNFSLSQLIIMHKQNPLFSSQNLYSLFDQGETDDDLHLPVKQEIIPWCEKNGVNVLAFSPLARGLLADGLDSSRVFEKDDERSFLPRFQPGIYRDWVSLANRLEIWSRDRGHTLVQMAIAWVLSNPGVSSVLVGAKTSLQIAAIVGAEEWKMSIDDLKEINEIMKTLPPEAAAARSIVWEHFPPSALHEMAVRRHLAK